MSMLPVSPSHSLELIEVSFFFSKLTADQVLGFNWVDDSWQVKLL